MTSKLYLMVLCIFFTLTTASFAQYQPSINSGNQLVDNLRGSEEDKFSQFLDYARFMGVNEKDISAAIWDGRLSPSIEDLRDVYGGHSLAVLSSWGATVKPGVASFNQGNIIELAEIFGIPHYNYLRVKDEKEHRYALAWINRFGPVPKSFFDFMRENNIKFSSEKSIRRSVALPTILTNEFGQSKEAQVEYNKTRSTIFKENVARRLELTQ